MKGIEFPIFKTKIEGVTKRFNLSDPAERAEYFQAKAGPEIKKIQAYLENPSSKEFVAFLLGKKNSGKGTYSKLFMEAVRSDKIKHLSVGDLVRDVHNTIESKKGNG